MTLHISKNNGIKWHFLALQRFTIVATAKAELHLKQSTQSMGTKHGHKAWATMIRTQAMTVLTHFHWLTLRKK